MNRQKLDTGMQEACSRIEYERQRGSIADQPSVLRRHEIHHLRGSRILYVAPHGIFGDGHGGHGVPRAAEVDTRSGPVIGFSFSASALRKSDSSSPTNVFAGHRGIPSSKMASSLLKVELDFPAVIPR